MTNFFVWDEKYDVGDDVINNQHKNLFEIANNIQQAKMYESGKYVMQLFTYTKKHFRTEEDHMEAIGFPELEKHRVLHDNLIIKLSEISVNFIQNEEDFQKFKDFVFNWMNTHVLKEDMKYFEYSKNS
jgi:hemerythrin